MSKKAHTGPKICFLANHFQFSLLGFLKVLGVPPKGTGIDHPTIQHPFIKVIADIIVMADILKHPVLNLQITKFPFNERKFKILGL